MARALPEKSGQQDLASVVPPYIAGLIAPDGRNRFQPRAVRSDTIVYGRGIIPSSAVVFDPLLKARAQATL